MAHKLEKILSEGAGLSPEQQEMIVEAWDAKLNEAKSQLRSELREEYAKKYEHDKKELAEAMDKFLSDRISVELEEYAEDRKKLAEERVEYKKNVAKHTDLLNKFVTEGLAKEVKELRADKVALGEKFKKLENFLLKQLAEEIKEFRTDRNDLVEQRVRMISEGKRALVETKKDFIARAAKLVESNIEKVLTKEISDFKEEIKASRENDFGRRIFEAFAGEFMTSHLNEATEVQKLMKVVAEKETEIKTIKESVCKQSENTEGLKKQLRESQDRIKRTTALFTLLSPLEKGKRKVMSDLLESVQTENLERAFNKYLPAVLNETTTQTQKTQRTTINESVKLSAKDGGRAIPAHQESSDIEFNRELNDIINLAGLKTK